MKSSTPPPKTPPAKTPQAAIPARTAQDADKYIVRFPPGMRDKISELAKANNRSMNAEIIKRLEWALSVLSEPVTRPAIPVVSGDIPYFMAQDIAQLANDTDVSFDQMLAKIFVAGIHPDAPQVLYMPVLPGATGKDVGATMRAMGESLRPDATIVSEMITRWSVIADMPTSANLATSEEIDPDSAVGRRKRLRSPT